MKISRHELRGDKKFLLKVRKRKCIRNQKVGKLNVSIRRRKINPLTVEIDVKPATTHGQGEVIIE